MYKYIKQKESKEAKILFLRKVNFKLDLDILEKELKHFSRKFVMVNLEFIDTRTKCYKIYNNRYYTNYTTCTNIVLFQKFSYIKRYC